mgnify:CR=1 FL=1
MRFLEYVNILNYKKYFPSITFYGLLSLASLLVSCTNQQAVILEQESDQAGVVSSNEEIILNSSAVDVESLGFFTRVQASRGGRRFEQLCTDCHRVNEIRRIWFGGERHKTAASLYNVISTTMPDSNPGGLDIDQYVDILAFLLSSNGYTDGDIELLPDLGILEGIAIPLN